MDQAYTHFVIVENLIFSGWEYKEDAQENAQELKEEGRKCKVLTAQGVKRIGLNPMNQEHWTN